MTRRDKIRVILSLAGAGLVTVILIVVVATSYWNHHQIPFQNLPQLIAGLQAFARDHSAHGQTLQPEISLQDLIRGGYLTANDVRAFDGMDVVFSTQANASQPDSVVARARTQDGQYICVLGDGSVQQFTENRYQEMLRESHAAMNPAKPVQSLSAETNQTSAPAGPWR
jgi:hypothetical protein